YIAVTTRDSLVADDYSKHGRGINQRLEKDQRALELGVQAKLGYALNASQGSELTIELLAPEPQGTSAGPGDIGTPSAFLILELSHPTMARLDRNLILRRVSEVIPTYRIQTEPLAAAYWHASIYPPQKDWRIRTRLDVSEPLPPRPGSQAN
ncbi:MAG: FixH family protein, partial [Burkholderiaceae bacterium]